MFPAILFFIGRQLCCPEPGTRPTRDVVVAVVVILIYGTSLALAGIDPSTVAILVSLAAGAMSVVVSRRARRRPRVA